MSSNICQDKQISKLSVQTCKDTEGKAEDTTEQKKEAAKVGTEPKQDRKAGARDTKLAAESKQDGKTDGGSVAKVSLLSWLPSSSMFSAITADLFGKKDNAEKEDNTPNGKCLRQIERRLAHVHVLLMSLTQSNYFAFNSAGLHINILYLPAQTPNSKWWWHCQN